MQQFDHTNTHLLVLAKSEELIENLDTFALKQKPKSAWLCGLGGSQKLTLGFYDPQKREYEWTEYHEPLEILSLQGNLSWIDGKPFWHIHGVFSGKDDKAIGGHVKELQVGLTGELFITPMPTPLTRLFDDETGLKLLAQD